MKYRGKQLQIYFLVSWSGEKEPTMSVCLMIRSKLLKEHASVFFHTWIGPKTMQRQREDDWPIIHSFSGKVQTKQASFIVVAPALLKKKKLKVSCRVSMAKQWIQNSSRLSMPKKTMPKTSKLLLSGRCHTKWLQGETELERFSFFCSKSRAGESEAKCSEKCTAIRSSRWKITEGHFSFKTSVSHPTIPALDNFLPTNCLHSVKE